MQPCGTTDGEWMGLEANIHDLGSNTCRSCVCVLRGARTAKQFDHGTQDKIAGPSSLLLCDWVRWQKSKEAGGDEVVQRENICFSTFKTHFDTSITSTGGRENTMNRLERLATKALRMLIREQTLPHTSALAHVITQEKQAARYAVPLAKNDVNSSHESALLAGMSTVISAENVKFAVKLIRRSIFST